MKSRLNLKPGQKGTKQLVEKYGKSLLYVRYRYDESRGVRLKTVGIVIEEKPWQPSVRFRDTDIVSVQVNFAGKELRDRQTEAGAVDILYEIQAVISDRMSSKNSGILNGIPGSISYEIMGEYPIWDA